MSNGFSEAIRTINEVKNLRGAKYTNYALTELGRQKAEEYGATGLEWEVLNFLSDNGPSTLREVAQGVHINEKKAKAVLNNLIAKLRVIKVAR